MPTIENTIVDASLFSELSHKLSEGKAIHQELPDNGIVYIDKFLPFVCVYRFSSYDVHVARIIKTQASYIIAQDNLDLSHLLEAIRSVMSSKFETFLVLEFWPERDVDGNSFTIHCPESKAPATISALSDGFASLQDFYPNMKVIIDDNSTRHPEHLKPLFNLEDSRKKGLLVIGVSLPLLFKNPETEELYSLFFREYHSVFSETVKRAVFEFIRVQTADDFEHFLMLGKTYVDEVTLKADRDIANISEGMSFLLRTTPVNSNEAWLDFKKHKFKKIPSFKYRLIALDPELQKRKLYNIPIDEVDDPTIAFILRGKRLEIEKQLTMLEERGTKNFRFVGESLYGAINKDVLREARKILKAFPDRVENKKSKRLNCHEFAELAEEELAFYNKKFPSLNLSVEIRNDVAGIMVSKTKLLINNEVSFGKNRADALIQHEIATHILTYCNGKQQPLCQMYEGFEGYDQLQEGLAVIAEYLVGGLTVNRLRLLAGRVVAVKSMTDGHHFIETFNMLRKRYSFSERISYYITMRVYRGGGLTKDAVYLAGLIDVMKYIKNGGSINPLYCGKFNLNHIELIEELLYRKVLKKPVLPRFLERKEVQKRLKKLKKGIEITELIN